MRIESTQHSGEIEEKPLSTPEMQLLAELESVILENLKGYVKVGAALAEIRERRLYRTEHQTFEEYVKDVWEMPFQRAYQLINATKVVDNLKSTSGLLSEENSTIVEFLPVNESQVRPLVPFAPDEQVNVWICVLKTAREEGVKVTAALVARCVMEYKGQALKKEIEKSKKHPSDRATAERISASFKESFEDFLAAIEQELKEQWQHTSKTAVVTRLKALLAAAEEL
jgi:hypothetical protein